MHDERFEDARQEDMRLEREVEKTDQAIAVCEQICARSEALERSLEVEKERERDSIPVEKVGYYGLVITEKGLDEIRQNLEERGIELVGREQLNMHMTCQFFGFKPTADRSELPSDRDLGKTVTITLQGFGDYRNEDGKILNQGFEVDKGFLEQVKFADGRTLLEATKNEIPHVTVAINPERDENNKPVAKAVDTPKCEFKPIDKIEIECRIAAFSGDRVFYKVDRPIEKHPVEKEVPIEKEKSMPDRELERIEVSKGALTVIDVLHNAGYNADLVGGCVRDAMLGLKPKDEDITTNLEPERVVDLFEREGVRVIPTGLQHGTVTVMAKNEDGRYEGYEVTTYRIDGQSSDQRHPDSVSFTNDIREDMSRRDFTINAMAFDPRATGDDRIKDFYSGREDLKAGIIRTVGDPHERIQEDALRMARAVRFAAQKDMQIDSKLKDAIKDDARNIEKVSKERINAELSKILVSDNARQGISNLHELGLLRHIAPSLDREYDTTQNNPWHLYDVGRHTERVVENVPNDKITRCAALFHDIGKTETKTTDSKGVDHFYGHPARSEEMTKAIMKDLKFTSDEIKNTCLLVRLHDERLQPDKEQVCRFIEKHPEVTPENFHRLIDLQKADIMAQNPAMTKDSAERMEEVRAIYDKIIEGPFRTSDLALDGRDIQRIQTTSKGETIILSGQDIKVAKEKMLGEVLRDPSKNTPSYLESYLRDNLKTIKDQSINRMEGQRREDERQAYRERVAINKIEKEIAKTDIERLKQDREILENTGFKSAYIAKIETLISRREELLESLKEKHTKATPRLSDEELKDKKEAERTAAKHEAYEKAVEKYCNEVGYSRLDYQTHEFYADRGQREHLPPEKLNPNKK